MTAMEEKGRQDSGGVHIPAVLHEQKQDHTVRRKKGITGTENSLSTGKDHESVASTVTSAIRTSNNAAPDE